VTELPLAGRAAGLLREAGILQSRPSVCAKGQQWPSRYVIVIDFLTAEKTDRRLLDRRQMAGRSR